MGKRPNIVFLITDQQRGDSIDPAGICKTPNIDRLAESGVRFTRAHTVNAICSPSRATMMTGLFPSRHGMVDCTHAVEPYRAELDGKLPMWPGRLAEAGYLGSYYGKWHVERTNKLNNFGFVESVLTHSPEYKAYREQLGLPKTEELTHANYLEHKGYKKRALYGVHDEPEQASEPYFLYSQGIDFIRKCSREGKSWFTVISTHEPHDPYITPREFYNEYDPENIQVPETFAGSGDEKPGVIRQMRKVFAHLSDRQVKEAIACYYGTITLIDRQIGRLLDALQAMGELDNTVVIFTSDHGDMMGRHGIFCKSATPYEDVYGIPYVISGSRVANPGRVHEAFMGHADLAPTILELTGAEPISGMDGHSLVPILQDQVQDIEASPWNEGFAEFHGSRMFFTQRLVWHGDYKYIFNGFDIDELYDLRKDPLEANNLAEDPAYRSLLEDMATRMWKRIYQLGDRNMINSHYPLCMVAPIGPNSALEGVGGR